MGLIKALTSSVSTALGDQFLEYVECPQIANDVIIAKGVVQHGKGNSNPSENIISNGSAIVVPEGMAMMIVENGKIVEFSAEPGTYTWDTSSEPSIFTGGLGKGIVDTIKTIGTRIAFGGQTAKDQRVYYVNIKIVPGLTFGSQQPELIADPNYGSVEITYNGEYAIQIDDPAKLVSAVVGANPNGTALTLDDIFASQGQSMLKSMFAQKVSEAISKIMLEQKVSFDAIQAKKSEVTTAMNEVLDADWHQKYGIVVQDVTLRINATEESKATIAEINKTKVMGQVYANNMQGTMAAATAEAMKNASSNENGAMMGFAGLNMATSTGAGVLNAATQASQGQTATAAVGGVVAASAGEKKFCPNCGAEVGNANFCSKCGTKLN